jgi:hypothetical protein
MIVVSGATVTTFRVMIWCARIGGLGVALKER